MLKTSMKCSESWKRNKCKSVILTEKDKDMKNYTCLVKKEGAQFASLCLELDVASCGDTVDEAIEGIKNAVDTYLEFMREEGRENEVYRPVPMNELKDFLFTKPDKKEYSFKAIPIVLDYA